MQKVVARELLDFETTSELFKHYTPKILETENGISDAQLSSDNLRMGVAVNNFNSAPGKSVHQILVFDTKNNHCIKTINFKTPIRSFCFNKDTTSLYVGLEDYIDIVDLVGGKISTAIDINSSLKPPYPMNSKYPKVRRLCISDDEKYIISSPSIDGYIFIFSGSDKKLIQTLFHSSGSALSLCFDANNRLYSASHQSTDSRLLKWNPEIGACVATLQVNGSTQGSITALCCDRQEKKLYAATYIGFIKIWDAESNTHLATLKHPFINLNVHVSDKNYRALAGLTVSSRYFYSKLTDNTFLMWDKKLHKPIVRFNHHHVKKKYAVITVL